MGVVVVEFEGDGDVAVFADFARRMGGKVDFRFGGVGFDGGGFVDKGVLGCAACCATKKVGACKGKGCGGGKGFVKEQIKGY